MRLFFFFVVQTSNVERQERCLEFVHDLNMLMMTSFVRMTYEGVVSKALTPCGAKNNVFAYCTQNQKSTVIARENKRKLPIAVTKI